MFRINTLLLLATLTFLGGYVSAQEPGHHHGHDHGEKQAGIEIGGSAALVYHIGEKALSPGFHIHLNKSITDHFGIGLGYEGIPADEYHQTLTLFGSYAITRYLSVLAGPGITFPNPEHEAFSLTGHVEIAASFELGVIHLGPFIGAGFSSYDSHVAAGLHIGWLF